LPRPTSILAIGGKGVQDCQDSSAGFGPPEIIEKNPSYKKK